MRKTLSLFVVLLLLMAVNVYAIAEVDYNKNNQEVTLKNWFTLTDIGTVKLLENTAECFNCHSDYKICNLKGDNWDISELDLNFYDRENQKYDAITDTKTTKQIITNSEIDDFSLEYATEHPYYVDLTRVIPCELNYTEKYSEDNNKTFKERLVFYDGHCVEVYDQEQRIKTIWHDFNPKDKPIISKDDCITIRVSGKIKPRTAYDNVLTLEGVELKQFAWWNNSFTLKRNVTLNSNVNQTLENFPAYFIVDTKTLIDTNKMQGDCDDIRVTDLSQNLLDYEVESCNRTNTVVYFRLANFTTGVDTIVEFYYNNTGAGNGENDVGVWINYTNIWHFDNTGYDNIGSNTLAGVGVTNFTNNLTHCLFGDCVRLNTTLSYMLGATTSMPVGTNPSSISVWGSHTVNSSVRTELFAYGEPNSGKARFISLRSAGQNTMSCDLYGGAITLSGVSSTVSPNYYAGSFLTPNRGQCCYNATCINGTYTPQTMTTGTTRAVTGHVQLPGSAYWASGGAPAFVDEVRISNKIRTAQWFMAEYGQTYVLGAVEEYSAPPSPPPVNVSVGLMTCEYNPTPYIKILDKIYWLCLIDSSSLNRSGDYKCYSYVKYGSDIIQINPDQAQISDVGIIDYFEPQPQDSDMQYLKAYFKKTDLIADIPVNFSVVCGGNNLSLNFTREITPTYKNATEIVARGVWLKDNAPYFVGGAFILLMLLIAIVIIVRSVK